MGLQQRDLLELKGHKVELQRLSQEHLDVYWDLLREGSLESNILTTTYQIFTKEAVEGYLGRIGQDPDRMDFLILSKETDKIVGEVVINDIATQQRSANIRIVINQKEDFGKGYGTEALVLALNYGFGMLNLHRIELEVLSFNKRAISAYEKVGFKKEGVKREACYHHHQYHDLIVMSLLEGEFRAKYLQSKESLSDVVGMA